MTLLKSGLFGLIAASFLLGQGRDADALREFAERLHIAYGTGDVNAVLALWNERSPEHNQQKLELEKLLKPGTSVLERTISEPEINGERGFLRVEREFVTQSLSPASTDKDKNKNLLLECVKDQGQWTIWKEMPAVQGLAFRLSETPATNDRNDILLRYQDLVGPDLASALLDRGTDIRRAGNLSQALQIYTLADTIAERDGAIKQHALALNNIGLTHYEQAEYAEALDCYKRSLAMSEAQKDDAGIARTLNNTGVLYDALGEFSLALDNYRSSLAIGERTHNDRVISNALANMALIDAQQGNYIAAFANLTKSYDLDQRSGNKRGNSISLLDIGNIFLFQGDYAQAEDCFKRSLAITESAGFEPLQAIGQMGLGRVQEFRGDFDNAIKLYENSLVICERVGQKAEAAQVLGFLGSAYSWKGDQEKALEFFQRATNSQKALGDARERGLMLSQMAAALNREKRFPDALRVAAEAAKEAEAAGSQEALWRAHLETGNAYLGLAERPKAATEFVRAINTIETLRLNIAGNEFQQESFFETKLSPYHKMIDLLVSNGRNTEAFEYAEKVRARVLMDIFRSDRIQLSSLMSESEREQDHRLRIRLAQANRHFIRARQSENDADRQRIDQLGKDLDRARLDYTAFETGLYAEHPEWKLHSGELQPVSLDKLFGTMTSVDTALVEFVITEDTLYTFVLTADKERSNAAHLTIHSAPLNREELAKQVHQFQKQLATRDLGFRTNAMRLYKALLGPIAPDLAGKHKLVVMPDGILWELPLHALVLPSGKYVIDNYAVSYAPSLSTLSIMSDTKRLRRQERAGTELLAMGNPTSNAVRRTTLNAFYRDQELGNLPHAEEEVHRIGQIYGEQRSNVYVESQARERVFDAKAIDANVIHLATHGILNNASPLYSQLLLAPEGDGTEDGLLEVWELLQMKLRAELVVLSACETARGSVSDGEGVIGLSWALMIAGVPTAVLSQWKVQSDSTSQLMIAFHENRRRGMDEASALRSAALKLRRMPAYQHPFYWAPFVVVGAADQQ